MLRSPARLASAIVLLLVTGSPVLAQVDGPAPGERPIRFRVGGDTVNALEGWVTVPLVRGDPSSPEISLRYVRFPATTSEPGSPIVYLAGGPGGSGIDGFRGNRHDFFMGLRDIADVVALDQRGTGDSEPDEVACDHQNGLPMDRPGWGDAYLEVLEPPGARSTIRPRSRARSGVRVGRNRPRRSGEVERRVNDGRRV